MPDPAAFETRAVLLTPPGRGAVALIAISGPRAETVVAGLLERGDPPAAGRIRHVWLRAPTGERLDDALVVGVPPDVAVGSAGPTWELGVHGGPAVVEAVFAALEALGARRGEWKHLLDAGRRAGTLDPLRAAALRRIGRTVSRRGAEVLAFALNGSLQSAIRTALDSNGLAAFEALHRAGERARAWLEPLRVVLTGPPNAGKSTLFNALLGWNRATVSSEAGTTRDAVEEDLLVDDEPIRLADTAGDAQDAVTEVRLRRSDVVLAVEDGGDPGAEPRRGIAPAVPTVRVVNKIDRMSPSERAALPPESVGVSALDGRGLGGLATAIRAAAGRRAGSEFRRDPAPGPFTRPDRTLIARVLSDGQGSVSARRILAARARLRAD